MQITQIKPKTHCNKRQGSSDSVTIKRQLPNKLKKTPFRVIWRDNKNNPFVRENLKKQNNKMNLYRDVPSTTKVRSCSVLTSEA